MFIMEIKFDHTFSAKSLCLSVLIVTNKFIGLIARNYVGYKYRTQKSLKGVLKRVRNSIPPDGNFCVQGFSENPRTILCSKPTKNAMA